MHQGWMLRISVLTLAWSSGAFGAFSPQPIVPRGSFLLDKTAVTISYNPAYKQADWVFYGLGPDELQDCYDRPSSFRPDPELGRGERAELSDYRDSGYDRGHLSPAGDNKWNDEAMSESFLLSNISPQPARFNRGLWSRLESLVRAWASETGGLWVTTGPVLRESPTTIGNGRVAVPDYFYKVLATRQGRNTKAIALLMPKNANSRIDTYAVTVDTLESFARVDVLHGLAEEEKVESQLSLGDWDFKAKFQYAPCTAKKQAAGWFKLP